ncbi:hypothetical protein TNCV_364571 [Trichonephila clavipes]|nr:hypothetical protein TNCV_364571 [Trichonephila clavipes]
MPVLYNLSCAPGRHLCYYDYLKSSTLRRFIHATFFPLCVRTQGASGFYQFFMDHTHEDIRTGLLYLPSLLLDAIDFGWVSSLCFDLCDIRLHESPV